MEQVARGRVGGVLHADRGREFVRDAAGLARVLANSAAQAGEGVVIGACLIEPALQRRVGERDRLAGDRMREPLAAQRSERQAQVTMRWTSDQERRHDREPESGPAFAGNGSGRHAGEATDLAQPAQRASSACARRPSLSPLRRREIGGRPGGAAHGSPRNRSSAARGNSLGATGGTRRERSASKVGDSANCVAHQSRHRASVRRYPWTSGGLRPRRSARVIASSPRH